MHAHTTDMPLHHDSADVLERVEKETMASGTDYLNFRAFGARRLTMAQAVAAKWIARYGCDGFDAIRCKAENAETVLH
ncbi:MAG: hypothetical protein V4627_16195 [Pseudomonadota bacterium]